MLAGKGRKFLATILAAMAVYCSPSDKSDEMATAVLGLASGGGEDSGSATQGEADAYLLESSGADQLFISSSTEAFLQVMQDGTPIFEGMLNGQKSFSLTGTPIAILDGKQLEIKVIPAGDVALLRIQGNGGTPSIIFQGSCWQSAIAECQKLSLVDAAILSELKKSGDVLILTSTANINNSDRFSRAMALIQNEVPDGKFNIAFSTSAGTYLMAALAGAGAITYMQGYDLPPKKRTPYSFEISSGLL